MVSETGRPYAPGKNGVRLMLAMMAPESYKLTVAELAAKAGIGERTYYRLMADPQYRVWLDEQRRQALARHVDNIMNAAVTTAARDGRDGHQDRKMLLEMAGLYVPKQAHEVGGAGGQPLTILIGGAPPATAGPVQSEGGDPDG